MLRVTTAAGPLADTLFSTSLKLWALWLMALFAAIALTALALLDVYPPGDVALTRTLQALRLPGLDWLSRVIYRIGLSPIDQLVALAVAVAIAIRRRPLMATFVAVALLARGFGGLLKELVERPRPSPFLIDVSERANGFAFPSGHVLGAVLLWGFIYFASGELISSVRWRSWVRWTSLSIIALMGFQRVYAGAHWPSDVLGAYLWGGVILFALVKAHELCGRCLFSAGARNWAPIRPN